MRLGSCERPEGFTAFRSNQTGHSGGGEKTVAFHRNTRSLWNGMAGRIQSEWVVAFKRISQLGHASIQTTFDRYGHLLPLKGGEVGLRLDATVFGGVSEVLMTM